MAIKRKAAGDIYPHLKISSYDQPKRLTLGRGSSEKYHQHGKDLARQGKYEEALKVLSEAVLQQDAKDNMANIYDSRSAIYCKTGQYKAALSDAKYMISTERQSERGYLRAGKALLLENKAEKALDVYEYALKTMTEDNPGRKAVIQVRDKLLATVVSWLRDPIQHLNHDCLLEIFKYLPFRQIVVMTRLSKTWRTYLKSQPCLWYDISFKGARPLVTANTMQACIRNSQGKVKRLQLHRAYDAQNALLQASRCPRLEHLDLDLDIDEKYISHYFRQKTTIKTLILSNNSTISPETLCQLLSLPNLERFEAHLYFTRRMDCLVDHVPNLKALNLEMKIINSPAYYKHVWDRDFTLPGLSWEGKKESRSRYYERAPKLEELRLAGTFNKNRRHVEPLQVDLDDICHPTLRTLDIAHATMIGPWKFSEGLEHIRMVDASRLTLSFDQDPEPLELPNLKSLILTNLDWLSPHYLPRFLTTNNGSLETLRIEPCNRFRASELLDIFSHCDNALKNLKTLSLTGMGLYILDDETMLTLLHKMPHLKELHLPNSGVSGLLIKRIVALAGGSDGEFPTIEYLNVKGCENVSYEAAELGRSKGLKVITR